MRATAATENSITTEEADLEGHPVEPQDAKKDKEGEPGYQNLTQDSME